MTMAAARRWSKEISHITECPICVETLTEPKGLPCYHTFCLKCLLKYGEHDKPGDQVACPLCRANFVIPPGGFVDLPNNFFVNKLLLANQLTDTSGETVRAICELCSEDNANVKAEVYCTTCELHLCEKCSIKHKKPKAMKSHQLVNLKDKPSSESLLKMTASYCTQHPDEQIKLYCYDCKVVTCVLCHVTEHNKHECSDVKKSADDFGKQLDDDIEKVTSCAQQSRDKLQQLKSDSEGFLENLAATQQAISDAYDKLKSLLDSHLSQLMEELNTIKTKRLKEIECKRDELERQCVVVESFKKYCEEMKEKGTACDISRTASDMRTRSAELVKAQEQYNRQELDRVELTFTPSPKNVSNLIGVLAEHHTCSIASLEQHLQSGELELSSAEEFIIKAKVSCNIKCNELLVSGIARLGTELFVCAWSGERIAVYDLNTYSKTRHVTVSGLKGPRGLAACKQNNCLYISAGGSKCIHRVDLSNGSCSKWSLNADPRGLSLTKVFNLLVTLSQSIEEYTTDGGLIRSIKLDVSIDSAQHAIELSSGQFAVCDTGSAQHRVCVVDTAGRIVHSYGGPIGSSAGQLNWPYRLAVDSRGCVFVTDSINNRVQVLSPTLARLGDVITPGHQLNKPCALHLDQSNGRLYVGEWNGNQVIAISVKNE